MRSIEAIFYGIRAEFATRPGGKDGGLTKGRKRAYILKRGQTSGKGARTKIFKKMLTYFFRRLADRLF
jgi:hypothetical protein